MKLIELKEEHREDFQRLVNTHGNFLQSWAWGDFQKTVGKKIKRYAIEENGEFVFVCQGIWTKQRNKAYLFLPYGPIVPKENFEKCFDFFATELKQIHPELLFVRFEYTNDFNLKNSKLKKSVDLNPYKTLILDITKSEEELLKAMHHKTRYNIKVAAKRGVEVKVLDQLGEAGKLFLDTAKRQGIKAFEQDYYEKMINFFKEEQDGVKAKLYTAWHEEDILAANLMIYSRKGTINNLMIYLFGGSADIKRNMMGPYAMHWQAIKDAKSEGYEKYDLWGYESDPNHPWHGFSKFKAGFSGEESSIPGTYDYVYSAAWYNAYKILRAINRKIR